MNLLIATHNPAKFERYRQLLKSTPNLSLFSLTDLAIAEKVPEPFPTAAENSLHKAREYARISGYPTLAIDESVTTNFLPENEQPGVYVRRFAGTDKEMTDQEALEYWHKILAGSPVEDKRFIWQFAITFYRPQTGQTKSATVQKIAGVAAEFSSTILPGYPMSSFMVVEGTEKPHAELTESEKLASDRMTFQEFLKDFPSWVS